ncbi:MAG: helix-turn-helix transcriptional regulator [Actinomycetota bacterium]
MAKPTKVTNRIGELRRDAGEVSQGELATAIGVTRQTLNAIERGKYSPSLEVAFRIARFFDVGLDDVFTYRDDG